MGNNMVKDMGITPTKVIGTKDLNEIWKTYAKDEKRLPRKEAKKFLRHFAKALGVDYESKQGAKWLKAIDTEGTGYLDYDKFLELFLKLIEQTNTTSLNSKQKGGSKPNLMLTETLATKLDFQLDLPEEEPEEPKPTTTTTPVTTTSTTTNTGGSVIVVKPTVVADVKKPDTSVAEGSSSSAGKALVLDVKPMNRPVLGKDIADLTTQSKALKKLAAVGPVVSFPRKELQVLGTNMLGEGYWTDAKAVIEISSGWGHAAAFVERLKEVETYIKRFGSNKTVSAAEGTKCLLCKATLGPVEYSSHSYNATLNETDSKKEGEGSNWKEAKKGKKGKSEKKSEVIVKWKDGYKHYVESHGIVPSERFYEFMTRYSPYDESLAKKLPQNILWHRKMREEKQNNLPPPPMPVITTTD